MKLLVALALFWTWQEKPPETATISGVVVDSVTGAALTKARVMLSPMAGQMGITSSARTNDKGEFTLSGIEPGRYTVIGSRTGYVTLQYGARVRLGSGAVLTLHAGDAVAGIKIQLPPTAVIAGIVRDREGDPIEGVTVTLGRATYGGGRRDLSDAGEATTDDRGQYRIGGLSAGKYYVLADPRTYIDQIDSSVGDKPRERDQPTFYPGVLDAGEAAPVEISVGRKAEGTDITVRRSRVFRVSGTVVGAASAGPWSLRLTRQGSAGLGDLALITLTKKGSSDFEFAAVPQGLYTLFCDVGELHARRELAVGSSDVTGLQVTLAAGADVRLQFSIEGEKKVAWTSLHPNLSGALAQRGFDVLADGTAIAKSMPPDTYVLRIFSGSPEVYVKSANLAGKDVLVDGIKINGPGTIEVAIVLATDGGIAGGIVRDKDGQPMPGATVALVPNRPRWQEDFRHVVTDPRGRFEWIGVPPGEYKAYAWDEVEDGEWNDPDFLRQFAKQAEAVTVDPNGHASVDVKLGVSDQR